MLFIDLLIWFLILVCIILIARISVDIGYYWVCERYADQLRKRYGPNIEFQYQKQENGGYDALYKINGRELQE